MIDLITEYYVLNALSKDGWFTVDEVSPSEEWDDGWEIHRMLETLENAKLVEGLRSQDNTYFYHITSAGRYRLQQLSERLDFQCSLEGKIQDIYSKLNTESLDRQKAEKINAKFQWANLILVTLTLVATIIFGLGLHSCADTATNDTSGAQESEFAVTDSATGQLP